MAINFVRASSQYLLQASAPITAFPCSMACWFKSAELSNVKALMCQARGSAAGDRIELRLSAAEAIVTAHIEGTAGEVTTTHQTSFSSGVWTHAAGVWNGTGDHDVYKDGVVGTNNTSGTDPFPLSMDRIAIGARPSSTVANFMDGAIAEAALWNAALSAADIAALAKGLCPLFVRPDALVGYWPLIGNASPEVDLMGRRELTWTNAPTKADHPRIIKPRQRKRSGGFSSLQLLSVSAVLEAHAPLSVSVLSTAFGSAALEAEAEFTAAPAMVVAAGLEAAAEAGAEPAFVISGALDGPAELGAALVLAAAAGFDASADLGALTLGTAFGAAALEAGAELAASGALVAATRLDVAGDTGAGPTLVVAGALEADAEIGTASVLVAAAELDAAGEFGTLMLTTAFGGGALEARAELGAATALVAAAQLDAAAELQASHVLVAGGALEVEAELGVAFVLVGAAALDDSAELGASHVLVVESALDDVAELTAGHVLIGAATLEASAELGASHVAVGMAALEGAAELGASHVLVARSALNAEAEHAALTSVVIEAWLTTTAEFGASPALLGFAVLAACAELGAGGALLVWAALDGGSELVGALVASPVAVESPAQLVLLDALARGFEISPEALARIFVAAPSAPVIELGTPGETARLAIAPARAITIEISVEKT